jgi:hypothetical protein
MPELSDLFINDVVYPNTSFVTDWVNLVSANSIYITSFCSSDAVIQLDYAVDENHEIILTDIRNISAGVAIEIYLPVKTRFLKLSILGISPPANLKNQAFFYETSVISKLDEEGGTTTINVSDSELAYSSYGGITVENSIPKRQYLFLRGTNGTLNPKTFLVPYSDIRSYDSGILSVANFSNGIMKVTGFNTVGKAYIHGSSYKYRTGQGMNAKFTANFFQGVKNPLGTGCTIQLVGAGNFQSNIPYSGAFFGYADDTLIYEPDSFGVCIYRAGIKAFTPRTAWNRDRANGTNSTLNITNWELINVFQIQSSYLEGTNIRFFVYDRFTNKMVLVHEIVINGLTQIIEPSFALILYQEITANSQPLALTDAVGSGSGGIFVEGKTLEYFDRFSFDNVDLAVTSEVNILSLRCNPTWYGTTNYEGIDIDCVSVSSDGNKNVMVKVYKNCTLTTPTWVERYTQYVPSSTDTVGTFGGLGTGILLYSFQLAKIDDIYINLSDLKTYLDPSDVITFTAQSAQSNEVSLSCCWHGQ